MKLSIPDFCGLPSCDAYSTIPLANYVPINSLNGPLCARKHDIRSNDICHAAKSPFFPKHFVT